MLCTWMGLEHGPTLPCLSHCCGCFTLEELGVNPGTALGIILQKSGVCKKFESQKAVLVPGRVGIVLFLRAWRTASPAWGSCVLLHPHARCFFGSAVFPFSSNFLK